MSEKRIYHIVPSDVWEEALEDGVYRADTLDAEGFIHLSKREQVVTVANMRFNGHNGLLLLEVDPTRVEAELKYEVPYEDPTSAERFPHLFGPLNLDAVIAAHPFEPGADGSFELPEKLG